MMRLVLTSILVTLALPFFGQSRLDVIYDIDDSTKIKHPYQWWLGLNLGGMEIIEHVDDANGVISPMFNPNFRIGVNAERHGRFFFGFEYHYYPLWQVLGLDNQSFGGGLGAGMASGTDAVHNLGLNIGKDFHPVKRFKAFTLRPMAGPSLSFLPLVLQNQQLGPVIESSGSFSTSTPDGQFIFGTMSTSEPNFMNVLMTVALEVEMKLADRIGVSLKPYFTQGFATQYQTQVSYSYTAELLDTQRASLISYGSNAGFVFQFKFRVFDTESRS